MRDINRIEPFLEQLEILWKQNPDMRFYQLIYAITQGKDMFYTFEKNTRDFSHEMNFQIQ